MCYNRKYARKKKLNFRTCPRKYSFVMTTENTKNASNWNFIDW